MHEIKKIKNERITNEFLFVMYFWGFTLLHPLLSNFSSVSTVILFGYAFSILAISIYKTFRMEMHIEGSYVLIYCVLFVLLMDCLFRINNSTSLYMYDFLIYGIIPVYLFTQINDTERLLRTYSIVSLITFVLYFWDPLQGYPIFGDYMTFGFSLALPAYFGIYIGRKYFKRKWMFVFEILCLAETAAFANRSVLLSIIVFWIVLGVSYAERSIKKDAKIIAGLVIGAAIFVNLKDILFWAVNVLDENGLSSYSLVKIQNFLQSGDFTHLFSGRLEIWSLAQNSIYHNFILGSGTASFEAMYGLYTHNLYFDIMTQYGLTGLVVFVGLIVNSLFKIHEQEGYVKLMGIVLFCFWFPKLFFSIYFYKEIGFWCFLAFGFLSYESSAKRKEVHQHN